MNKQIDTIDKVKAEELNFKNKKNISNIDWGKIYDEVVEEMKGDSIYDN